MNIHNNPILGIVLITAILIIAMATGKSKQLPHRNEQITKKYTSRILVQMRHHMRPNMIKRHLFNAASCVYKVGIKTPSKWGTAFVGSTFTIAIAMEILTGNSAWTDNATETGIQIYGLGHTLGLIVGIATALRNKRHRNRRQSPK